MNQQELSEQVKRLILDGEDWLIKRVISYAKRQGYTRYTSTLEEAWRISIHELSSTLVEALGQVREATEFTPDETFSDDPISAFAVLEADRHRERGIELKMFLGLFKYYRQSYLDRINEAGLTAQEAGAADFFVTRIFDRLEIAFCSAWAAHDEDTRLRELQDTNRRMTNEKNRFLTVTESLGSPVIHFDKNGQVTYANQAAAPILGVSADSSSFYYCEDTKPEIPAWLMVLAVRARKTRNKIRAEHSEPGPQGEKIYDVQLHPMLDVSERYQGTVAILHDVTALRNTEHALAEKARLLERLSHTDPLTGLYNRRGLVAVAEKHMELARRTRRPLSVLYGDVDNLKTINDELGHAIGDAALVALSKALLRSFRAADIVARVGGDEFVALLPDSGDQIDDILLDRTFHNLNQELDALGENIQISVSIGSARFDPERHRSFDQLLAEADAEMYRKKQLRHSQGRRKKPSSVSGIDAGSAPS